MMCASFSPSSSSFAFLLSHDPSSSVTCSFDLCSEFPCDAWLMMKMTGMTFFCACAFLVPPTKGETTVVIVIMMTMMTMMMMMMMCYYCCLDGPWTL